MKHIMLLFLSEVHLNSDRTLSISLYDRPDGSQVPCVQTNESAVRYTAERLQKQGEQLDCIFYFSTKRTRETIHYMDTNGQQYAMTHEDLFLKRVRPLAADYVRIEYDETSKIDGSIHQVMEMADSIRAFMKDHHWQPQEVALHADLTGGFRHASMMMLSVMQLLKYRKIRTTDVLYSNRNEREVENVTDIYRMFNLVSGADEFVNFGSTREITAYMQGHAQTEETKNLLTTMRSFTDAVRICRTGKIAPLAHELQKALKDFEDSGAVSLQEKIFLRILEVFKSEYGSLLKDDFTRLDIIRWCVDKGYLQQAMTLCTEWIPEEIVSRKIFYPAAAIEDVCLKTKKDYQSWQQYFLIVYAPSQTAQNTISLANHHCLNLNKKAIAKKLREAVKAFYQSQDVEGVLHQYPAYAEKLRPLLEALASGPELLRQLRAGQLNVSTLQKKSRVFYLILNQIYEGSKSAPTFKQSKMHFFQHRQMKGIYNRAETFSYDIYQKLLSLEEEPAQDEQKVVVATPAAGDLKGIYCNEPEWNQRQEQYLKMRLYNIVQCGVPTRETLEILHDYFQVRRERNNINHANAEDALSTDAIKDLMLDLLQRIEENTASV